VPPSCFPRGLNQDIQHFSLMIDSAPQIPALAVDRHEHLVNVPPVVGPRVSFPQSSAKGQAQQPIETVEVIHMPVRDEYVTHTEEFAGRKIRHVAKIEKDRPLLEFELDVEAGIAESAVNWLRMKSRGHGTVSRAFPFAMIRAASRWHCCVNAPR